MNQYYNVLIAMVVGTTYFLNLRLSCHYVSVKDIRGFIIYSRTLQLNASLITLFSNNTLSGSDYSKSLV